MCKTTTFILLATLAVLTAMPVKAQELSTKPPLNDPMPIEIALVYNKLQKIEPDFVALMELNPYFKDDPSRFGNEVMRQKQYATLKGMYDKLDENSVFLVKKRLKIKALDMKARTIFLEGLNSVDPFVFELTPDDNYGIFLRNADEVLNLTPPYEFDELPMLVGSTKATFPAEIIVKPVAADKELFPLADGKQVKPVIADVVEITLFSPSSSQRIGVIKRFNDWRPVADTPSLLELKDNPLDDAIIPPPTK